MQGFVLLFFLFSRDYSPYYFNSTRSASKLYLRVMISEEMTVKFTYTAAYLWETLTL